VDTGSQAAASRPDCVLVVDDEQDILESLKDLLEASLENVTIRTANSGQQGLKILEQERVDLIISDYKMPNMNGLDFLMQAQKTAPGVPRILLTAFPDLGIAVRAINETGIENFITKPFEPSEAVETVARILHERRKTSKRSQAFARSFSALKKGKEGPQ
jgi:adenylate cyclase